MNHIVIGRIIPLIFDMDCKKSRIRTGERYVLQVIDVDFPQKKFLAEVHFATELEERGFTVQPAMAIGTWDFSGNSEDVPSFKAKIARI